jgi:hypothetical protein
MSEAKKKPLSLSRRRRELDTPRFLLRDAAYAAGISVGLLKAWLSREPKVIALGPHDRIGTGKGSPRLLTLRRVICITFAAKLVSMGFTASQAGIVAWALSDGKGTPIDRMQVPFFIIYPGEEPVIIGVGHKAMFEKAFDEDNPSPCVVINCATVIEEVYSRLSEIRALKDANSDLGSIRPRAPRRIRARG